MIATMLCVVAPCHWVQVPTSVPTQKREEPSEQCDKVLSRSSASESQHIRRPAAEPARQ